MRRGHFRLQTPVSLDHCGSSWSSEFCPQHSFRLRCSLFAIQMLLCVSSTGLPRFGQVCRRHAQKHLYSEKRSEEHTSELQSRGHLVCRLLLEKKKIKVQK